MVDSIDINYNIIFIDTWVNTNVMGRNKKINRGEKINDNKIYSNRIISDTIIRTK